MSPASITILIFACAVVLFVADVLPMGLVVFSVPLALCFSGVITPQEIFAPMVGPSIILVVAMCVVGAALFKTGMAAKLGETLFRYCPGERSLVFAVVMFGGILSGFVSNTGTVAVLLPIVMGAAAVKMSAGEVRCIVGESSAGCAWRVDAHYEKSRPSGAASLSGVTWVSNSTYLAVTDWGSEIWEMNLPLDCRTGNPGTCKLRKLARLERGVDLEDVAIDPLDLRSVWIADENRGKIVQAEYTTGKILGELELGALFEKTRTDMGLESVAITRDGKELWTTSEEALECDGAISDRKLGTCVRLTRFCREASGGWRLAGQWVYRTDPIDGASWKGKSGVDSARSGVSGLCCLSDGTLLVLEREFSVTFLPRFRCRVYAVDISSATEVSHLGSLKDAAVREAGKTKLFEKAGFSMYEGICEGPELADGARSLVLVSDGDGLAQESLLVLKLVNQKVGIEALRTRAGRTFSRGVI